MLASGQRNCTTQLLRAMPVRLQVGFEGHLNSLAASLRPNGRQPRPALHSMAQAAQAHRSSRLSRPKMLTSSSSGSWARDMVLSWRWTPGQQPARSGGGSDGGEAGCNGCRALIATARSHLLGSMLSKQAGERSPPNAHPLT